MARAKNLQQLNPGDSSPEPFSSERSERLLTREELAERLGCSRSQVDVLKDCGAIPHLKLRGMVRYHWETVLSHVLDHYQIRALDQRPDGYNLSPTLAHRLLQQQEHLICLFEQLVSSSAEIRPTPQPQVADLPPSAPARQQKNAKSLNDSRRQIFPPNDARPGRSARSSRNP